MFFLFEVLLKGWFYKGKKVCYIGIIIIFKGGVSMMIPLKNVSKKSLYENKVDKTNRVELRKREKGMKVSLLSDVMLKAMFFHENRLKYSCKLFSYYLDVDYEYLLKNLKLAKNELDKETENSKGECSDYVAFIDDNYLNIEVNCNDDLEVMERNMEYAHRLYARKIKRGSSYEYTSVIQFNLNNFSFVGNDKIVDYYFVQNDDGILLSNKLVFVQIYIPNLRKKWYTLGIESLTEEEKYLLTLVEQEVDDSIKLGKGDKVMEDYINEAVEVSSDFSFGEAYDKEWALKDQGHREGIKEANQKIIHHMLEKYDVDSITKITGIPKDEVLSYLESN